MELTGDPKWLEWSRKLQSIGQTGLAYTKDPYDRERFEELREMAVEIFAHHTGEDMDHVREILLGEVGYATPKVDVRGAVVQDGKILLVQETMDSKWTLPGGWCDIGATPSESVTKEVYEESGYETRAVKLLGVLDRSKQGHPPCPFHIYKLIFLCEITGGAPATSIETSAVGFFAEDNLPELSLSRTTPGQIHRILEHVRNPDLPTDFD